MSCVLRWSTFPLPLMGSWLGAVLLCLGCGGSDDGGVESAALDESAAVAPSDEVVAPDVTEDDQGADLEDDRARSVMREDAAEGDDGSSGGSGLNEAGQTADPGNQPPDEGEDEFDTADGERDDDAEVQQVSDDDANLADEPPGHSDEREPPEDMAELRDDDAGSLNGDGPCPSRPPAVRCSRGDASIAGLGISQARRATSPDEAIPSVPSGARFGH